MGTVVAGTGPAAAQGFGWFGNLFGGGQPRPQTPRPSYPGGGYPGYPGQGYARPGYSGQSYPGQGYPSQGYTGQGSTGQGSTGQGYRQGYGSRSYGGDYDAPRRRPPRHRQVEQATREAPPKEKVPPKNASLFVDVFGDSLGQTLANGLDDAFNDRQDVAIVHKARAASGLVTADTFDWPKAIADALDGKGGDGKGGDGKGGDGKADAKADDRKGEDKKAEDKRPDDKKIDVAVMMIGTNDRQPIHDNGATLAPGTPAWTAAYRHRVAAIDEAFHKHGVPLVWVGVPIIKDDAFADDIAAFNDIYREDAAKSGATYVDTWEAFSDEDGDFNTYGPDVNGQTVRLRAPDGVHFTRAGERKLAHFVETHVRRDLEGKVPVPQLPTDGPAASTTPGGLGGGKPVVAAVKPDAGPIKSLTAAPVAANGQLSAVATYRDRANRDGLLQGTLVRGEAASAPSGRADDMRWSADAKAN